jgi:HEXXH motif-containing protein
MIEADYDFKAVLPRKGRAAFLINNFNNSLIDSLIYMIQACEDVIDNKAFLKISESLHSLNRNKKLSAFLSFLNIQLYKAIEDENLNLIQLIVPQIQEHLKQYDDIQYISFNDVNDYLSPLILNSFSYTLPEERRNMLNVKPLTDEQFNTMKKTIEEGYQILHRVAPELYDEAQELTSQILFINSPGLKAGSSFDFFGLYYCDFNHYWRKKTGLMDLIAHEQGHLYLHLLNNFDPLVINAHEVSFSPVRRANRPMMGVYHATFVLARMIYVVEKALEAGEIPAEEEGYCQEQIKMFREGFEDGMQTIASTAELTPLAQGLLDTSQELIAA